MAVSLPTAADVRKVREQAAKNAAERAEAARTPLLAVLGAGDAAVTAVTKAAARAQTRGKVQAEQLQAYFGTLPQKFNADEARKTAAALRVQAETAYAGFAERGEKTWGKIRSRAIPKAVRAPSLAVAWMPAIKELMRARSMSVGHGWGRTSPVA